MKEDFLQFRVDDVSETKDMRMMLLRNLLIAWVALQTIAMLLICQIARSPKTWISMSLCVSSTASHKSNYSYKAAVILSTYLWRTLFDRNVLVQLIYENDEDYWAARDLEGTLLILGADVLVTRSEVNISCVLMGQTARILAYNHHAVSEDDIVMTADTDLFPTNPQFLGPLGRYQASSSYDGRAGQSNVK